MKSLLKKILSRSQIEWGKAKVLALKILIYKLFSRNRKLSSLYYFLFSPEFGRECQSVLKGKIKYHQTHTDFDMSNSALLRRNVHRMEKGLIMQPRRPIFGTDYVEETVNAYRGMLNCGEFCEEEKSWAHDVLSAYFDAVGESPQIDRARAVFESIEKLTNKSYVPYTHDDKVQSDISTEQLHNLFRQRRSTRWFSDEKVAPEMINEAITLASLAPSACNRQPFNFYVAQTKDDAVTIAKMAAGTGGFAENIPNLIAVVGNLSSYPFERDRHLIYIDGALAAMQLMLAFETMGLSSCPINWPDTEFREQKISKKLKLDGDQRVIMLIAVGYADNKGMIPYSSKKTYQTLRVDVQ